MFLSRRLQLSFTFLPDTFDTAFDDRWGCRDFRNIWDFSNNWYDIFE